MRNFSPASRSWLLYLPVLKMTWTATNSLQRAMLPTVHDDLLDGGVGKHETNNCQHPSMGIRLKLPFRFTFSNTSQKSSNAILLCTYS